MWVLTQLTVFCPLCTSHVKVCSCFSRSGHPLLESAVKVEGAKLQLLSLTSGLNGLYRCEASNPHGSKHSQLYVHVASGEVSLNLAVQFVQIFLDLFLTFGFELMLCHFDVILFSGATPPQVYINAYLNISNLSKTSPYGASMIFQPCPRNMLECLCKHQI